MHPGRPYLTSTTPLTWAQSHHLEFSRYPPQPRKDTWLPGAVSVHLCGPCTSGCAKHPESAQASLRSGSMGPRVCEGDKGHPGARVVVLAQGVIPTGARGQEVSEWPRTADLFSGLGGGPAVGAGTQQEGGREAGGNQGEETQPLGVIVTEPWSTTLETGWR